MLILHPNEKPKKILIKKYANRRLYDMTHSQYLTQDELVEIVKGGHEVTVVDSKSKQEITQYVLTQILLEKGKNGTYLFSSSFLHQMIRYRDGLLTEFFTDFVPKLLESYLEMKDTMRRQLSTIASPVTWLTQATKERKQHAAPPPPLPDYPAERDTELDRLKDRILELERELQEARNR